MNKRIVIESPLSGDFVTNYRYLLWCCRAVRLQGFHPLASHLIGPWFLDDANPSEREQGMGSEWVWAKDVPHWFFLDRGMSDGMIAARTYLRICCTTDIQHILLEQYHPEYFMAFKWGEWPPHTKGFEVKRNGDQDGPL